MIPYEELCQALDRFNARRRNEAEMAALEQEPHDPYAATDPSAEPAAVVPDAPVIQDQPSPEAYAATAEDPGAFVDGAAESGFAQQAPEDTHEIDVEDVEIDERLSEDKLP
jgi:hypothetical protein